MNYFDSLKNRTMDTLNVLKEDVLNSHKSSTLNCGFLINPYRFGGGQWDYEDDFTTNKMTYSGTFASYNSTNDNQDFTVPNAASNPQSYVDMLGGAVSNTTWILRGLFNWTSYTANSVNGRKQTHFGLFSTTSGLATTQDCLSFCYQSDNSTRVLSARSGDGVEPFNASAQNFATDGGSLGNNGIQIVRNSATQMTVGIYDNLFSSLTEEEVKTIASTIQSLRYLQHSASVNTTVDGTISGTLDDIQFADARTTPP